MAGGRRARGAIVRQATASIYEAAQRRAHEIAREIVREIAESPFTPVDTGRLKHGYYVDTDSNGDALIKSRTYYWKYVEFGTRKRKHRDEQPHLRPAIEIVRARHQ